MVWEASWLDLARHVLPILAPMAKTVAKTALKTGGHIMSDVISGERQFEIGRTKTDIGSHHRPTDNPEEAQEKKKKDGRIRHF